MVIDLFNIDFNQKKIQSALYNKIEKYISRNLKECQSFRLFFKNYN